MWFDESLQYSNSTIIHAISEPGHDEQVISYLVIGETTSILIDTGLGISNIKNFIKKYSQLPIEVINTHSHWDHIGGNYLFDKIAIHELEASSLELGVSHEFLKTQMTEDYIRKPLPLDFKLDEYMIPPSKANRLLTDGDIIKIDDYTLQVIHMPGHSPGSICLWNSDLGHLFTGDVIYQGPLFAHLTGSNVKDYFSSIKKLKKIQNDIEIVFPAHNKTPLEPSFISDIIEGFEKIENESINYQKQGSAIVYSFEKFKVFLKK